MVIRFSPRVLEITGSPVMFCFLKLQIEYFKNPGLGNSYKQQGRKLMQSKTKAAFPFSIYFINISILFSLANFIYQSGNNIHFIII